MGNACISDDRTVEDGLVEGYKVQQQYPFQPTYHIQASQRSTSHIPLTQQATYQPSRNKFTDVGVVVVPPYADVTVKQHYQLVNDSLQKFVEAAKVGKDAIVNVTIPCLTNILQILHMPDIDFRETLADSMAKANVVSVLAACIKLFTNNGRSYPSNQEQKECLEVLLSICWNASCVSSLLGQNLCKYDIVPVLTSLLKNSKKSNHDFQRAALSILHNCARFGVNNEFYQDPETIDTIAWYARYGSQSHESPIAIIAAMTLAYIIEEKDNGIIQANDSIITSILLMLQKLLQTSDHRAADGFSVEALIAGLSRLANNKKNSILLVQKGFLELVVEILKSDNDLEREHAAGAVWALAFSDENRKMIVERTDILDLLRDASNFYTDSKLKRNAKGALWELIGKFEKGNKSKEMVNNGKSMNDATTDVSQQAINQTSNCDFKDVGLVAIPPHADETVRQYYQLINDSLKKFLEAAKNGKNALVSITSPYLKEINEICLSQDLDFRETLADSMAKANVGSVLAACIKLFTKNGRSYPSNQEQKECLEVILWTCWNASDASSLFGQNLCKYDIVPVMTSLLKNSKNSQHDYQSSVINILLNCSRFGVNNEFYQDPGTIDTIAWYARYGSQSIESPIAISAAMTLAHIIEEKDNGIIQANDSIITSILLVLQNALETSGHRAAEGGWSVEELIAGLSRLANNKKNSILLVQKGFLELVLEILKSDNDSEREHAASAVWALAFSDENRKMIVERTDILDLLRDASNFYTDSKLKRNAKGALWELTGKFERGNKSKEMEEAPESPPSQSTSGHIMISYNWGCQELMIKLNEKLKASGYSTWMDVDKMGEDLRASMAEAVENSAVILAAMTSAYKKSNACRSEANYAVDCKIPLIPLKVQKNYKADGWLGFIIAGKLYYEVTDEEALEKNFSSLIKAIESYFKSI